MKTNEVESKLSSSSLFWLYEDVSAFEPEITPVVVTAPDELIDSKVVDPDTKVTFPSESVLITLVKKPVFLVLLISIYCFLIGLLRASTFVLLSGVLPRVSRSLHYELPFHLPHSQGPLVLALPRPRLRRLSQSVIVT